MQYPLDPDHSASSSVKEAIPSFPHWSPIPAREHSQPAKPQDETLTPNRPRIDTRMREPETLTVQDDEGHRGGHRRERRGGGDDEDQQEGDDGGQRCHRLPVEDRGLGASPSLALPLPFALVAPRGVCGRGGEMVNWAGGRSGRRTRRGS